MARDARVPMLEVELVCSDVLVHQRRVETRSTGVPGLVQPDWQTVLRHGYEPWLSLDAARLVVDSAFLEPAQAAADVLAAVRQRLLDGSSDGLDG